LFSKKRRTNKEVDLLFPHTSILGGQNDESELFLNLETASSDFILFLAMTLERPQEYTA
jgi:hypothetical protein